MPSSKGSLASDNRLLEPSELTNRHSPSFLPLPTRKSTLSSSPAENASYAAGSTRSLPKGPRKASFTQAFHTMTGSKFQRRRTDDMFSSENSQNKPSNPGHNMWAPDHRHGYETLLKEPITRSKDANDEPEASTRRSRRVLGPKRSQSRQGDAVDFNQTAGHRAEPRPSQIPTPVATPGRRIGQTHGARQGRPSEDNDEAPHPRPRGLTRTGSYFSHLDTYVDSSSALPRPGMIITLPSSVSNLSSVSSMSVYPTNEHVSLYDPRTLGPEGEKDKPELPQLTDPFTDSEVIPLTTSASMKNHYPISEKRVLPSLPSMAHIKENLRSAIQPFRKESYAHLNQAQLEQMQKNKGNADIVKRFEAEVASAKKMKQDLTPHRSLMQPIHPPLPRSQTLGTLVACGTGTAGGRPSSETERPGISERANRNFGAKGTYASTASVPGASKSTSMSPVKSSETSLRSAYKKISAASLPLGRLGTRTPTDGSYTSLLTMTKVSRSGGQDDCSDDLDIDEDWYGSESESMSMPPVMEEVWVTVQGREYMEISNPQPEAYWLGRFVALNDRFHSEDNFPNNATSNAIMISSDEITSRETLSAERARTKRVFLTLQAICGTDEARASLRDFWTRYSKQHGGLGPMSTMGMELPVRRRVSAGFSTPFIMGSVKEPKEGKGKEVDTGDTEEGKGDDGVAGGRGIFNRLRGLRRSFSGGKGGSE